ncbi:MAG: hypothetical protein ACRDNK_22410 [Solirubrobacteraceae bacterium]
MTKFLRHLQANLVAYLALFVALGGTGYAALRLPAGSVGARQLKNHSITPIKLDRRSTAGYVRDWITIDSQGRILGSRPKAHLTVWRPSGPAVGGLIQWSQPLSPKCVAFANAENSGPPFSYATAEVASGGPKHDGDTYVYLSAPAPAVNVVVVCPQP